MKKLSVVLLAIIMLLALASCQGNAESAQALKELEEKLGSLDIIPVEIEQAVALLGEGAKQYEAASERGKGQSLAIADGTVLYATSRTDTEREGETEFKFQMVTLYIGKVKSSSSGEVTVTIAAANIKMIVLSEDVEGAKEAMLSSTNGAPISSSAKSMMNDLIDGKQVSVSAASSSWEVFCDLDREVTFVCSEDGTFKLKKDVEVGRLYRENTEDEQGRPLKIVAYYYDEEGNEYIEEINEYVYNADNSVTITFTYYYPYSTQIKEVNVSERLPVDVEDGMVVVSGKMISSKEYYESGTLKKEYYGSSVDSDEGYVAKTYSESGHLLSHYEQKPDGTNFSIQESYYDNGNKKSSIKMVGNESYTWYEWEYEYYENGKPHILREYYESGMLKSRYEYYETGAVYELVDYYDGENNHIKQVIYGDRQKDTYYPNGKKHTTTMYFGSDMTRVRTYEEFYENDNMKEYYENNEQGERIDVRKWYENGTWQYNYGILDDGTIFEYEYYIGDPDSEYVPMKKSHELSPDGSEYIGDFFENGSNKYDYYYDAVTGNKDETFYELVDGDSIMVERRTEHANGNYTIVQYHPNGNTKYNRYVDMYGNVIEVYYDEQGNIIHS